MSNVRTLAFEDVPPEVATNVADFLEGRPPPAAEVYKPGRVWRLGELVIKRWPAPLGWERLRESRALASARLARSIGRELTAQPLLVATQGGLFASGASLLVMEFIAGSWLHRLAASDQAAREAFPKFVATLHQKKIAHPDFNIRNCLWDGSRWVLIDLDGVRTNARITSAMAESQWARILGALRLVPGSREMFQNYARLAPITIAVEDAWPRVEARAKAHFQEWDRRRNIAAETSP